MDREKKTEAKEEYFKEVRGTQIKIKELGEIMQRGARGEKPGKKQLCNEAAKSQGREEHTCTSVCEYLLHLTVISNKSVS